MRTFETWIKTKRNSTNPALRTVAKLYAHPCVMLIGDEQQATGGIFDEARAAYEKHCARYTRVRAKLEAKQ